MSTIFVAPADLVFVIACVAVICFQVGRHWERAHRPAPKPKCPFGARCIPCNLPATGGAATHYMYSYPGDAGETKTA